MTHLSHIALCAALLASLLQAPRAGAQVNVETLRSDLKTSGFGGKLDASLDTHLGNTQGSTVGANLLFGLATGRQLMYAHASGDYSHLGGETQVSKTFLHGRYNLELTRGVWGEVFGQLETDRFRRIAHRELVGVGPRFELTDTKELGIYYGAAYMLEHTRLKRDTPRIPSRPDLVHRFSNYAAIGISLGDGRVELNETIYYQPRFDNFGDYRVLSVTGMDFEVLGSVTAGISATLRFEDPTPHDVRRLDFSLENTLGLEF